jgi:signal transduction histidine kinase
MSLSYANIPENIELVFQLSETLPDAFINPEQIGQAFDNIILNAVESMPNGGRMIFNSVEENSEWIAISVSDTGMGISEENQEKLFETFFSTKTEGIGLGLTIAKTMIDIHNGTIDIQSKLGVGSTFKVRLPVGVMEQK